MKLYRNNNTARHLQTNAFSLYFFLNIQYDYIITGSGCAGLSLLYRILKEPALQSKHILVIDAVEKNTNDKTWCFWEKTNGLFEDIVLHRWQELIFRSATFSDTFSIEPYQYKMIRGIDFYRYVLSFAERFPNVHWVHEKVESVYSDTSNAVVITEQHTYTGKWVFNSILFNKPKGIYNLLQHFKGWFIQTEEAIFNPRQAMFMDFSVNQKNGTAFMYVLPVSPTSALVEYTLFTASVLEDAAYTEALQHYIQHTLSVNKYTIVHEEFGIIPMTDAHFPLQQGNIINIGTAGGQTKASSGYTFQFIQKQTEQIVQQMLQHTFRLQQSFYAKKFKLYDKTLLNVLSNNNMNGDAVFTALFKNNSPQAILQFLDNETSLRKDLKILQSVPTKVFLPAAMQVIWLSLWKKSSH